MRPFSTNLAIRRRWGDLRHRFCQELRIPDRSGKSEVWIEAKRFKKAQRHLVEKERLLGRYEDARSSPLIEDEAGATVFDVDRAKHGGLVTDGRTATCSRLLRPRLPRRRGGPEDPPPGPSGPHNTPPIEYIPEEDCLIVPSLYDNRLTAYRLATHETASRFFLSRPTLANSSARDPMKNHLVHRRRFIQRWADPIFSIRW